jgi:hypothetical protein
MVPAGPFFIGRPGWLLPEEFATLRRLLEARLGKRLDFQSCAHHLALIPDVRENGVVVSSGYARVMGCGSCVVTILTESSRTESVPSNGKRQLAVDTTS